MRCGIAFIHASCVTATHCCSVRHGHCGDFITVWNNVFVRLHPNFGQPTSRSWRVCVRVLPIVAPSIKSEGARDAGVPKNPRTSMRRRIEAFRKNIPQVRRLSNVPRAVFIGLLRATPGGLSFQNPYAIASSGPTHRFGPRQRLAVDTELRRCRQEARCRELVATGSRGLDRRVGCACCTRARPPRAGPA